MTLNRPVVGTIAKGGSATPARLAILPGLYIAIGFGTIGLVIVAGFGLALTLIVGH